MNKLLALTLLLSGVAYADTLSAAALRGYTICIPENPVSIDDPDYYLLSNYKKDLADWLKVNLLAYRLATPDACANAKKKAYVDIGVGLTKPINSINRGYLFQMNVWAVDSTTFGIVTLWTKNNFGVTARSNRDIFDSAKSTISEGATELAADYNLVNP